MVVNSNLAAADKHDRMTNTGRPQRIGLVAPYFPPHIGGANIYCHELAKAIAEKGHEVHVFAHQDAQGDGAYTLHAILKLDLEADLAQLAAFDMDVWHSLFLFYAPLALRSATYSSLGTATTSTVFVSGAHSRAGRSSAGTCCGGFLTKCATGASDGCRSPSSR